MKFTGAEYSNKYDYKRLAGQLQRIFELMKDGQWRTLSQIAIETHAPESSVSANLRNLRKQGNGEHTVERRVKGDRAGGLFVYRLIPNTKNIPLEFDKAGQGNFIKIDPMDYHV